MLDAISKSDEKGAATRAETILNKMQSMYEEGAEDVQPDTFSFASVLNAYANSDEPGAAEKSEEILKHMQLMYENGNHSVRPNTICFATVIVSMHNDIHTLFRIICVRSSLQLSESIFKISSQRRSYGRCNERTLMF